MQGEMDPFEPQPLLWVDAMVEAKPYVLEATYWMDEDFTLKLRFRSDEGGKREINTEINLPKDEWFIMGGLMRDDPAIGVFEYKVAVRLVSQ